MINCMNLEKIKNLLINISQFEIIKIIDNSSSHASHKGVQGLLNNLTHVETVSYTHLTLPTKA